MHNNLWIILQHIFSVDHLINKKLVSKSLEISTKDDSLLVKRNVEYDKMPFYQLQKPNDFIINIHRKRKLLDTKNKNILAYENYKDIKDQTIFFNEENNIFKQNVVGYAMDDEDISIRTRRSTKQASAGQSPVSVSYAINYKEKEHRGWVKPVFSSIVYRLPVSKLSLYNNSLLYQKYKKFFLMHELLSNFKKLA